MDKRKHYSHTKFGVDALREAIAAFDRVAGSWSKEVVDVELVVQAGDEKWTFDNRDEFFSDYRREQTTSAFFRMTARTKEYTSYGMTVDFHLGIDTTSISVSAPTRSDIEAVFEVFEGHHDSSLLPPIERVSPTIFIGHGRNSSWRDLKDHLHEQHGYAIEAYETGSRAGHAVRDILADMAKNSSFATLVMTAEDITPEGSMRARQNVVHEVGLFQGRLGFSRAIALVEDGVEVFSNMDGIHQIRFSKGRIKETFGDVLATIRREFGAH